MLFVGRGNKHLTGCIEEAQGVGFTPNHYSYCIVVKNLSYKSRSLVRKSVQIIAGMYRKGLTVGTYSEGNLLVVYEINKQVFPTAPSPTTTHLIVCISVLR